MSTFIKSDSGLIVWSLKCPTPHIRAVASLDKNRLLYVGLNQNRLSAFIVNGTDVESKIDLGEIGIWGKTILHERNPNEFLVFTDKKRKTDFESNIEVIRLKIDQ
jgi:hypothetical protein